MMVQWICLCLPMMLSARVVCLKRTLLVCMVCLHKTLLVCVIWGHEMALCMVILELGDSGSDWCGSLSVAMQTYRICSLQMMVAGLFLSRVVFAGSVLTETTNA